MTAFWKENEYEYFSPGQICLYFFLLNRANSRHWQMPIKCETSYASRTIGIPLTAIIDAREGLYKRGLLHYQQGSGRGHPPLYYLILDPKEWKELPLESPKDNKGAIPKFSTKNKSKENTEEKTLVNPPVNHAIGLQDNIKGDLKENDKDNTVDNTQEIPQESPNPFNIKNEKLNIKNKSSLKEEFEMEKLEKLLLSDDQWKAKIQSLITDYSLNSELLDSKIKDFFVFLKSKGWNKREEMDCKNHFFNWLNKNLNRINNGNLPDTRRGYDVSATSPKDYDGAF